MKVYITHTTLHQIYLMNAEDTRPDPIPCDLHLRKYDLTQKCPHWLQKTEFGIIIWNATCSPGRRYPIKPFYQHGLGF